MHIKYSHDPILGTIFMVVGIIFLAAVALHFAPWIILAIVGWKLFSWGMRMRGYPPLALFLSRWF